jgi:hypothetical protein
MGVTEATQFEKTSKRRVGRSPAYPYIPVQKALDQAKALHAQEGEYAAPLASAVAAWGYSPKSSGGRQTLATMKYYGLIDIAGEGDSRKIKISDIARRILLDHREDDTEKRQLIRRVALTPAAHQALYKEYPKALASPGSVEHFLIFDQGYNKDAAKELLEEFKQTAQFAGLYEPSAEVDKSDEKNDKGDKQPPKLNVGDKVQINVAGVDMYADGATVLGFSDDGAWVFTDKSDSAAKIEEVTLIEAAAEPPVVERPLVPAHLLKQQKQDEMREGWQEERLLDDEGGEIFIRYEGEVSVERYEFIRDYLDFKLSRLKPKK